MVGGMSDSIFSGGGLILVTVHSDSGGYQNFTKNNFKHHVKNFKKEI